MTAPDAIRNRLLAVIAALLAVAGLRWSQPVTMPLAAAIFLVAVVWPVKPWLDRKLLTPVSYAGAILTLALALTAFGGAVYLALAQTADGLAARQDQFRDFYEGYVAWAKAHGLPVPDEQADFGNLVGVARRLLGGLYTLLGYLGAIAVLVVLGLPEVPAFRHKIRDRLQGVDGQAVGETCGRIAAMFRGYVGVTVLVSLVTGLASAAWAFALGLDLALTWGVLNFLLNFIPVVGNILGIIPPTLFALLQFGGWTWPLVTFIGYAVLQVGISNFVYPWLQGQRLSLSPAVVIVALAFWSWVWGIGGALLAVPLTAAGTIICDQFGSTRWIAQLLRKD
jgi:AI-2 transport protein TqsA